MRRYRFTVAVECACIVTADDLEHASGIIKDMSVEDWQGHVLSELGMLAEVEVKPDEWKALTNGEQLTLFETETIS